MRNVWLKFCFNWFTPIRSAKTGPLCIYLNILNEVGEHMAENIVLVGMMGVGKTAVGRLLAEELAFDFVDLDAELEQVTGLKLPEIYRKYGQIRFYSEDKLLLGKQLGKSSQVFAADGALPPQAEHLRLWRQMGCVVWLQAEAETVFRRMRRKKNRLFLPKQASVETVQQMMAEREPLYAETADFAVNVDKWALEQVAAKILAFYRRRSC